MKRVKKTAGRYHHGHLRDALVVAAEQHIAQTGGIELTLREIARRAGVSHAAAYRHFDSKAALLAEVATRGYRLLADRLSGEAGLKAAAVTYVSLAAERPGTFRVMFHPALKPFTQYPMLVVAAGAALEQLHRAVADEVQRGTMRDDASHSAVSTSWATIHGLATLLLDGQLAGPFSGAFVDVAAATERAVGHLLHR